MDIYQIYYLNSDPIACAREHCDEHVKTQCFEIGMLLSYVCRVACDDEDIMKTIYHPKMDVDTLYLSWLKASDQNWKWLYKMWAELFTEYEYRFEKEHVTKPLLSRLHKNYAAQLNYWDRNEVEKAFKTPPYNVPDPYQQDNNKKPFVFPKAVVARSTLNSYRNWYDKEFIRIGSHTKRESPVWSAIRQQIALPPADEAELDRLMRAPTP